MYRQTRRFCSEFLLRAKLQTRNNAVSRFRPRPTLKFVEVPGQKRAEKRKHTRVRTGETHAGRNYAITSCIPAISGAFAMRFGQRRRNSASGMLPLMDVSDTRRRRREKQGSERNGAQIGTTRRDEGASRRRENERKRLFPSFSGYYII